MVIMGISGVQVCIQWVQVEGHLLHGWGVGFMRACADGTGGDLVGHGRLDSVLRS